jgi:predicted small secreted protein
MNTRKLILPIILGIATVNFAHAQVISFSALDKSYTYKAEHPNKVITIDAFTDVNGGHIIPSKFENDTQKLLISYPNKVFPAFTLINRNEFMQVPLPSFDLASFSLKENRICWQINSGDDNYSVTMLGFKQGLPPTNIQEISANNINSHQFFDIKNLSYAQFALQVKYKGVLIYTTPSITNPNLALLLGNPIKENIVLESFFDGVDFSVKNSFGQNICSGALVSGANQIKLPAIDKGLYFFVLGKGNQLQTFKIIKE